MYDSEKLKLVGMIINEPGFKVMENELENIKNMLNSLDYITGNTFQDGVSKGEVKGVSRALYLIKVMREECGENND
jgi:hypothetical protein